MSIAEQPIAESQANANLIAAAPDLLVVVEELVSHLESYLTDPHVSFAREGQARLDQARAALRKARGEAETP